MKFLNWKGTFYSFEIFSFLKNKRNNIEVYTRVKNVYDEVLWGYQQLKKVYWTNLKHFILIN